MTNEQAKNLPYNPFDLTKIFSQKDFPLRRVGKITLNENPENYFAQIEQSAFSPAHMPPGIEASPDKMLQVNSTKIIHQSILNSIFCLGSTFFIRGYASSSCWNKSSFDSGE
jgi:hypothetical protein